MSRLSNEFYRTIGRKGGQNGKWSPAKRESARRAAQARWSRHRYQERIRAEGKTW